MASHHALKRALQWIGAFVVLIASGSVVAQSIHCESRDYRRNYCATGTITGAQIISQTSNAACIQGRTWGWDANGIWVNNGCAGDFAYQGGRRPPGPPPIGTNSIECESRDYRQNFCGTGVRISRAWVSEQRSSAPCIQGRTWGWDGRGIWVSQGCSAVFSFAAGGGPPPPPIGNSIACESRDYQQAVCNTGRRVSRAWVAEQRSQSPCVQGRTWGWRDRTIWVSGGCGAVFAYESR
ncbi:MAG: DUF3011 domain-containing protein [Casimicrobiaceae bacterium]